MEAGQAPSKLGVVENAVESLSKEVINLEEAISRLATKLEPALLSVPPTCMPDDKQVTSEESPLARSIMLARDKVQVLNNCIQALSGRCQL